MNEEMHIIVYSKLSKKEPKLTVVLLESPSDWAPWATAPFGACPPANTKANDRKCKHIWL